MPIVSASVMLAVVLSNSVFVGRCNVAGATIAFGGRECVARGSACIVSGPDRSHRLKFIGDRILYSLPTLPDDKGWAFKIGAEVDMETDPVNRQSGFQSKVPFDEPGGSTRSLLRADIADDRLILTRRNELRARSGRVVANSQTKIAIRLTGCGACVVEELSRVGSRDGSPETPEMTFADSWCALTPAR